MGCPSGCGSKGVQASVEPYQVKLADGTTVTVTSKAQERAERDKAFVRVRAANRQAGYSVTR